MKRHVLLLQQYFLLLLIAAMISAMPQSATAATEQILYNFNPLQAGSLPDGGVVADAAGNLYGVSANGGAFGHGTVFEFSPNQQGGWDHKILYSFKDQNDGGDPEGGVIFDGAGNLYGMTLYGGPSDSGTVFELEHHSDGTWTEKVLHHIMAKYSRFLYGLVFDAAGNLYGTLESGGQFGGGVVFELSPASSGEWKQTILYNFGASRHYGNGIDPVGRVIIDNDGNLFGVTFGGGIGCVGEGCGTVYELSPTTCGEWKENILYEFTGQKDGEYPAGALIFDGVGNLYGAASRGGPRIGCECGNVFKLTPDGNGPWTHSILYMFKGGSDGNGPAFPLIFDSAGNLYGVTENGGGAPSCGITGCGTAFELSPNGSGGWDEKVLTVFDPTTTGYNLSSGLFLNAEGQLIGEGWEGPTKAEAGFIYSLTPANGQWNYTAISNFTFSDAADPQTALVADSKGNLYGTTEFGGTLDMGAVFQLSPSSNGAWSEKIIYSFNAGHTVNGTSPTALPSSLILDSAGNLYGETGGGGSKNDGTIYKLSPLPDGSWQQTTIYSFLGGVGGNSPSGCLLMDSAGNLYGTTQYGGKGTINGQRPSGYGLVFELSPAANGVWTEKTLYQFGGYPIDGALSLGALIFDSAGNLYGTTSQGGSSGCTAEFGAVIGCGTAFELSATNGSWYETILHSFVQGIQDGQTPYAGLAIDKAGNLFGTTLSGGSNSSQGYPSGTVFELSPQSSGGWKESLIADFPDAGSQSSPVGNILIDASGNLYSTTENYGGSVFELSPVSGGWNYNTLYSFAPGSGPQAGLIFGPNGYLYGTSGPGGTQYSGFVFSVTPQ